MKKPAVDYRKLNVQSFGEAGFSHLKLLLGWPVFFALYLLTDNLIPAKRCTTIHCALDDIIPFCELFVVPYVLWYGLIVFSLGYFLLYNADSFRKLQSYMIIVQLIAMLIYLVFPSRQELRPESFPAENFFTALISFIYRLDSDTCVCPSLHCAISIGIASVWIKQDVSKTVKAALVFLCIIICASTMFIKQHSFLDFLAALPLCILTECIVFHKLFPNGRDDLMLRA